MDTLKRKRRRAGGFPVNQLFIGWVEELRDEAKERGVKSQYAYSKAVNSLKKYPLPLSSGEEARILDHIGVKLATILSKKLSEHQAQQAAAAAAAASDLPSVSSLPHTPSSKVSKATSKKQPRPSPGPSKRAISPLADAPPKTKRRHSVREYVPQYRSGPYSILIALFEAQQSESWCGYLRKSEVIERSQPHCDTSFTICDDGSYYTAWSSMSTVIKKGFVSRWSNPAKFRLTEPGVDMALKLLTSNPAATRQAKTDSHSTESKSAHTSATQITRTSSPKKTPVKKPKPCALLPTPPPPPVIEISDTPPTSPSSSTATDLTEPYSMDEDTHTFTHKPSTAPASTSTSTTTTSTTTGACKTLHSGDILDLTCISSSSSSDEDDDLPVIAVSSAGTCRGKGKARANIGAPSTYKIITNKGFTGGSKMGSLPLAAEEVSARSKSTLNTQTSTNFDLPLPDFQLRPGEFEVLLCVDNAESTACRKSSSQFRGILLQDLTKNGVLFDVRKLSVGDFAWVARRKLAPPPDHQLSRGPPQEAVLEYIVERKRMDDLAGSIMDGRFSEQKFRLKNCGVINPIYLVEEYGDSNHLKLPERSLQQAIANTQVIDGFYVKRTQDIRESVAYLTLMTRKLQQYYARKTINVYSMEALANIPKPAQSQQTVLSMPFDQFNQASAKTKPLSVYEMFARQLIQLPFFSGDKAVAVLQRFPTVSHLREAYRNCTSDKERIKLCADIRAGECKRRLGDKAGKLISSLYWKP